MGVFGPVLDGAAVAAHPAEAFADGSADDVPMLIGRNNDEGTLLMAGDPVLTGPDGLGEGDLEARLSTFGDRAGAWWPDTGPPSRRDSAGPADRDPLRRLHGARTVSPGRRRS